VTYDNVACAKTCTIPPGSHELSVNQSVAFAVVRGVPNAVSLTLDGIPASAALVPVPPSTLSGNSNAGFTLSKCTTQTQDVNVVGVDADGNQIVGPGAPSSPALTSDDTAHLAVGTLVPPSTFPLSPPATLTSTTIPSPGSVVHLTASVTPLSGTGASVVSSKINVTFNHDICGVLTEYSIPSGGHPSGIAAGSDGALWFTEPANYSIGRMTTSGAITEMTTPTAGSGPAGIAAGPNGAMWFAEPNTNAVGRVSNGSISEFSVITSSSQPFGITKGPDGNIWFTENGAGQIGSITPDGITIQEFTAPGLSHPNGITTGPDGHLWFADTAGKVGNITTAGLTAEESVAGASPSGIVAGPDGALWFAEGFGSNKIGRVTTDGTIAEYSIPTALSDSYGIVAGPDGALWFTEQMTNKIGRITTAGAVTVEYTVGSTPQGIAVGPDGLLWFAESGVAEIGRLQ
jgi:virginiamycin B lyase